MWFVESANGWELRIQGTDHILWMYQIIPFVVQRSCVCTKKKSLVWWRNLGQFSRSVVSDSLRPHELQHARPPCPITNSRSSLRLMPIESVMPSSHLILCHPLLLLDPVPPSIRVFSNESTLRMRWPKYWSFSFSIIPSKEIPGLISVRMD